MLVKCPIVFSPVSTYIILPPVAYPRGGCTVSMENFTVEYSDKEQIVEKDAAKKRHSASKRKSRASAQKY